MRPPLRVSIAALALFAAFAFAFAEDAATTRPAASPVDYHKLKALLPNDLSSLKRTDATGQSVKTGDLALSTAEAHYGKSDNDAPTADLTITDYSAAPGVAEGMTAWSKMELDQDSDSTHQRTLKIAGHPAMESFDKQQKHAEWQIWTANRYLVQITTDHLDEPSSQKLVESFPFDKLSSLK